jgi:transposase
MGRSLGGLSTKIHALVDALRNSVGLFLTCGQAHDLEGADHFLPSMQADTLIADKAFDADARVIAPLAAGGKTTMIPSKANRQSPHDFDREVYKERHLIENFFAKLKQFRAIATRYEKIKLKFFAAVHLVAAVIWLN